MTNGLTRKERAMGRDVIKLLAIIRDGGAMNERDEPLLGALDAAVNAGLATVDYEPVRHGGQGIAITLTDEGKQILCIAENGHRALWG